MYSHEEYSTPFHNSWGSHIPQWSQCLTALCKRILYLFFSFVKLFAIWSLSNYKCNLYFHLHWHLQLHIHLKLQLLLEMSLFDIVIGILVGKRIESVSKWESPYSSAPFYLFVSVSLYASASVFVFICSCIWSSILLYFWICIHIYICTVIFFCMYLLVHMHLLFLIQPLSYISEKEHNFLV